MSRHKSIKHPIKMWIHIPVLKSKVLVLLGSYADIKKKHVPKPVREYFDNTYFARCSFYKDLHPEKGMCFVSVIHSTSAAISVIAHEAVHAAGFICDGMGVKMDSDCAELTAYIVQFITEEVELKLYGPE